MSFIEANSTSWGGNQIDTTNYRSPATVKCKLCASWTAAATSNRRASAAWPTVASSLTIRCLSEKSG